MHKSKPLYPEVDLTNPEAPKPTSSSSSLYPSVDMKELVENLFPDDVWQNTAPQSSEEIMIKIPGAIAHLVEKDNSVELACGDLSIVGLHQGENIVAVLARVGDEIQWPLAKDEAAVKLDVSYYFFNLRVPANGSPDFDDEESSSNGIDQCEVLNYGITIASKGQENLLREFDKILENYSCFSVQTVEGKGDWEVIDGSVAKETSPEDLRTEEKKEIMRESSAAYWTTLAPNVEDYSGKFAKRIAAGSGHLIRGILWCGDVTVDRLKWGNEFLRRRMSQGSNKEISPQALRRVKRVKKVTKMSEKVATEILSGVVKVSGFFTSSIVKSKVGKKFFSFLPAEVVLASLDGFDKVCDAVEVAGRNVLSTTSVVTAGLVSHRYGEQAGQLTNEGLDAVGHAIGTAWAVFKIREECE
ncbi:hypothetical protein UlMin_030932 [Ulmus minor]